MGGPKGWASIPSLQTLDLEVSRPNGTPEQDLYSSPGLRDQTPKNARWTQPECGLPPTVLELTQSHLALGAEMGSPYAPWALASPSHPIPSPHGS